MASCWCAAAVSASTEPERWADPAAGVLWPAPAGLRDAATDCPPRTLLCGGRRAQGGIRHHKAGRWQALLLRDPADGQGTRQGDRVGCAQRMGLQDPTRVVHDGLGECDHLIALRKVDLFLPVVPG
jgi:hypothetical protein